MTLPIMPNIRTQKVALAFEILGWSAEVGLRAQGDHGSRNRILVAGQHRGSTSAIRTALNAIVAN